MGGVGVWAVGALTDDAVDEARRRFPNAASAHGSWPKSPDEMAELSSRAHDVVRFVEVIDRVRNRQADMEEFQEHLFQVIPQQEGESLFRAVVPRGEGSAALMWGLGFDTATRFPGCCGEFLFDAGQVREALAAAERALVLDPQRRAQVTARARQWLDEMADDPHHDIDELIDGPLRVLRHAERTGVGAAGLTLWY